jgi:integrase
VIIREGKTKKKRNIPLSPEMLTMLVSYCNPDRKHRQDELLFPSGKGGGKIGVSSFNNMVKKWCSDCGIRGNHGSHTLRKTWAYLQYHVFKTDLTTISQQLNHSSMDITYAYLGITPDVVRAAYSNFIGGTV